MCRSLLLAGVALAATPGTLTAAGPAERGGAAAPAAVDVAAVILQLGDENFAVRERAAKRLAGMGAAVADELLTAAETSADLEVALRARTLVDAISPLSAADAPEATAELEKFVRSAPDARGPIMHRLLRLDGDAGIEPLARLVRLERSPSGSWTAAALLAQEWRPGDPYWPQLRPRIAAGLAESRRPAARFLRALVAATDPAAVDRMPAAIAEATAALALLERERHRGAAADDDEDAFRDLPAQGTAAVRLLRRGLVDLLVAADRREDAIRELAVLFRADRERADDARVADAFAVDNLAWAIEHGLPEAVELVEQSAEQAEERDPDPTLTYARAVAWQARGRADRAAALADEATAAVANATDPPNARYEAATSLSKWGAFEWSDREFRALADDPATPAPMFAVAGVVWAESLHDRLRDDEAAAVLRRLFDGRAREFHDAVEEMLRMIRDDPQNIRARMAYFAACASGARGDAAGQRRLVEEALRHAAQDVDSLIALHALADSPQRKAEAAARVTRAAEQIEERIGEAGQPDANVYNEYAWLVANTVGDVAKATRYSRRSLELSPDSGSYLDTLAHCRAAAGDLAAAVRTQTLAQRREPASQTIRRNLDKFKAQAAGGTR
ncbi:MAG: hypothetical protein ACK6CT_00275 [Planctomycetia bacterium]|jgi:tetratricopeptide (TPR) repeat protein